LGFEDRGEHQAVVLDGTDFGGTTEIQKEIIARNLGL